MKTKNIIIVTIIISLIMMTSGIYLIVSDSKLEQSDIVQISATENWNGLNFSNIKITKKNNKFYIKIKITNTTEITSGSQEAIIEFKDKENNYLQEIYCSVPVLESKNSVELEFEYPGNSPEKIKNISIKRKSIVISSG